MKGKRYSEEQIIGILKEHEAGMSAQDVIPKHGIANGTLIAPVFVVDEVQQRLARTRRFADPVADVGAVETRDDLGTTLETGFQH